MTDLDPHAIRLGPLADAADEYAGPAAPADRRRSMREVVIGVLTERREKLATAAAVLAENEAVMLRPGFVPTPGTDAAAAASAELLDEESGHLSAFVSELCRLRDAFGDDPEAAPLIVLADECETLALKAFAATKRIVAGYPDRGRTELTPAEAEALRRYDERMLYQTVSPLALLVGGVAGAAGLFAGGPVVMAATGAVGYLAAIIFFEWSLRRVMR